MDWQLEQELVAGVDYRYFKIYCIHENRSSSSGSSFLPELRHLGILGTVELFKKVMKNAPGDLSEFSGVHMQAVRMELFNIWLKDVQKPPSVLLHDFIPQTLSDLSLTK